VTPVDQLDAPDLVQLEHGADEEPGSLSVSVSVIGPDGSYQGAHRGLPLDADHEQVADALVRCLLGAAAAHGGTALLATVYARIRQEVGA
jgi:hypothetical protein